MEGYLYAAVPVGIAIIAYFVRVESRLTRILTDLCWIKKELQKCPPS